MERKKAIKNIYKLVMTGVFTALTMAVTMFPQIPVPATSGYINVGDSIIFITSILFGPYVGAIAGGLGSCLADIITGYTHWAPFTFVIKGLEGLICGLIVNALFKKKQQGAVTKIFALLAMAIAVIEMVIGYFFGGWILKGSPIVAATSIPSNLIQGGVSLAIAYAIIFIAKLAQKINYNATQKKLGKQPTSEQNSANVDCEKADAIGDKNSEDSKNRD